MCVNDSNYNWAVTRQNLSLVCTTKLDTNQFTQLQRLTRKMKAVAQTNNQTYLVTYVSSNQQCKWSILSLWRSSLYFDDFSSKCHQWKNIFSFAQSENLLKEYEWTILLPFMYTKKEQTLSTWKQSRRSSLQETNGEGACLESFNFSCVVPKLNVY